MLRIVIGLVCASLTTAALADDPVLPIIVVTGGVPPIYLGGGAGPGEWQWDGSTGSDLSPSYRDGLNSPPICNSLAAQGAPKDCTRELAMTEGTPPALPQPSTWPSVGLSNQANERELARCYSLPGSDPTQCELDFKLAMEWDCAQFFSASTYTGFGSPYEICGQSLPPIYMEIQEARAHRGGAQVFNINATHNVGPFEFNVNVSWLDMMTWSPFNRLLAFERKRGACGRWFAEWDRSNCESYYPGRGQG